MAIKKVYKNVKQFRTLEFCCESMTKAWSDGHIILNATLEENASSIAIKAGKNSSGQGVGNSKQFNFCPWCGESAHFSEEIENE